MKFKIYITFLCLGLFGCTSTVDYRGKQPEIEDIEKIQVNQHNQEDVLSIIGSPTSTNLFGETKWFYVFKRTESTSFLEPKITEEQIVTISFDKNGQVTQIFKSQEIEANIKPVGYHTPTQGSNATILQQVFGNFGRHVKKAESEK